MDQIIHQWEEIQYDCAISNSDATCQGVGTRSSQFRKTYSNKSTGFTTQSLEELLNSLRPMGSGGDMNSTTGFAQRPNYYIPSAWRWKSRTANLPCGQKCRASARRTLKSGSKPRRLSIAGSREIKEEKNRRKIHSEWYADQVLRVVDLPVDVDTSNVSAVLKDGILRLDLPKAPHVRATRIEPRSA